MFSVSFLVSLTIFGIVSLALEICREETVAGFKGHDWVMFDDHLSDEDATYLLHIARRHQFYASGREHSAFSVGDKVYVTISFDGSYSSGIIKEQVVNEDREVIGYKVLRDILFDKYESALASSNITTSARGKHAKTGKESARKSRKNQNLAVEQYLSYFPKYQVWVSPVYPKCLSAASQKTLGMHKIKTDVDATNGLRNDDEITLKKGCTGAKNIPVSDRYTRAAAFLLCHQYTNPDAISYSDCPLTNLKRFLRKEGNEKYSWDQCDDPAPIHELLSDEHRLVLCWDFVQNLHDLVCDMKSAKERKLDMMTTYVLYGSDKPSSVHKKYTFEYDEPPSTKLLVQTSEFVADNCAVSFSRTSYHFRHRETVESRTDELITEDDAVDVLSKMTIKDDLKISGDPLLFYPTSLLHQKSESKNPTPGIANPALTESPKLSKRYDQMIKVVPFGLVYTEAKEIGQEVTGYLFPEKNKKRSKSSSSRYSELSVAYSVLEAYKGSGYSEEKLISAASFLDFHLKNNLKIQNAGKPLRIVAKAVGAIKFAASRSLYHTSKKWGLCHHTMTQDECVCKVVDPIANTLNDLFVLNDPIDGKNGAVTFILQASLDYGVSLLTESYGPGVYFTFEWRRDGKRVFNIEIGGVLSKQAGLALGTGIAAASVSGSIQVSLFFGRNDEISDYGKNIAFGWKELGQISFSFQLMFRDSYVNKLNSIDCAPAESALIRYLAWPVSPKCIRGFSFSFTIGVSVNAGSPIDINVSTTIGISKTFAKNFKVKPYILETLEIDIASIEDSEQLNNLLF